MNELTVKLTNNQLRKEIDRLDDLHTTLSRIIDSEDDQERKERLIAVCYELNSIIGGFDSLSTHLTNYYIE